MKVNKKDRPIAAGGPVAAPKKIRDIQSPVPKPIVAQRHPFVKWLEGLRPGALFAAGRRICTVAAVNPIPRGRIITLAVANHCMADQPVADKQGGCVNG